MYSIVTVIMYSESKPNARDKHYTGLSSIPEILDKLPADGPDVSPALVKQLLNMENIFNIEVYLGLYLCVCVCVCVCMTAVFLYVCLSMYVYTCMNKYIHVYV